MLIVDLAVIFNLGHFKIVLYLHLHNIKRIKWYFN